MRPVGRGDLAALHLPGLGVQIVERDLLPMDVEPAYDGHRDLLKLRRGRKAPARNAYAVNRDASELRRSPGKQAANPAQPGPMHVIYTSVDTATHRPAVTHRDTRRDKKKTARRTRFRSRRAVSLVVAGVGFEPT